MTTKIRDRRPISEERNSSLGFEGARPRAATVSMCRYTIPHSPIWKPLAEPATSLPDLILPPSGPVSIRLTRTTSRLSCLEERLASSAPSNSIIMSFDSESSAPLLGGRLQSSKYPEFTLLEEEIPTDHKLSTGSYTPHVSRPHKLFTGMDDQEEETPTYHSPHADDTPDAFGASPVLLSCLRDIARMSRPQSGM